MGNHGMVLRKRVTPLDLCIRSSFWQPNGRWRGVAEGRRMELEYPVRKTLKSSGKS